MGVNFTPEMGNYRELKPFKFWCQKVLPLVYDDSLSYYELLNKVVDYLNKTMEDVDTLHGDVTSLHDAYEQLQTWVNNYFDNLDVQEEINNKLDEMASSGALTSLIAPFIPDLVSHWLNDNITHTSPPVDKTLSISDAAADAKITGTNINFLEGNLKHISVLNYTKTDGYIGSAGEILEPTGNNGEVYTSQIPAIPGQSFSFNVKHTADRKNWCAIAYYDKNHNFITRDAFVPESDPHTSLVDAIVTIPTSGSYANTRFVSFTWRSYLDGSELINVTNINEFFGSVMSNVPAPLIMTSSQTENNFVEVVITPTVNIVKIPSDTLVCTNTGYIQMSANEVVIDISSNSISSTAIKLCFNTLTNTFDLVPYNTPLTNNQILIAEIRRSNTVPSVNINCRYTLNGQPFGVGTLPSADNVKAVNHRGYNTVAPENTLPAFTLSAIKGFKFVECDVQMTSDGVPVLLHDRTINRTARNADGTEISGEIYIENITYEQALQYDFGIWKGEKYAGTKIPTLDQFMNLCRNLGLHPYVEIIRGSLPAVIQQYIDVVKKYNMIDKTTFIATNTSNINQLHTRSPKSRLGYVVYDITQQTITDALTYQGDNEIFIDCEYTAITNEKIQLAMNNNLPVEAWIVDNRDSLLNLNPYITGVTSNNRNVSDLLYQYTIKDYV